MSAGRSDIMLIWKKGRHPLFSSCAAILKYHFWFRAELPQPPQIMQFSKQGRAACAANDMHGSVQTMLRALAFATTTKPEADEDHKARHRVERRERKGNVHSIFGHDDSAS